MQTYNRREFLKTSALGTSMLLAGGCLKAAQRVSQKKPNIIFLMDDQHRWDTLGLVNPAVHTPTLDALAKSGVFFDQAVCQAPMCTPSRNSLMVGLYPNQIGILKNGRVKTAT
ncbi:MAG: sulfatase-like hydrolase/transferase, partial [Planctomycetes bacterium]|nr:sulfatase-like hydrolase/transferase [Planctomycetota bacterium]